MSWPPTFSVWLWFAGVIKGNQLLRSILGPSRDFPSETGMTKASANIEQLGQVVLSAGAGLLVSRLDLLNAIKQHFPTGPDDEAERRSFRRTKRPRLSGCRLLSVHRTSRRQSFFLITEADRSLTSVLLPQEF